jgi:NAD(P)-dependent dehydrogenase (short-subunit alcohol dehydrogenase family)
MQVVYTFQDRVALVTGAAGALGAAVVQAFAASDAKVIGVTHSAPPIADDTTHFA